VELGLLASETEVAKYYPHSVGHHIGLDVHDRGTRTMQENMVITIEPGIYVPEESPCDKKWWGIAVRIEDDYLVNKEGCELLSGYAPRTVADIEAMMKQPSPLDKFKLPSIDAPKK
jgi:Xaa-Pro aminopeptidase